MNHEEKVNIAKLLYNVYIDLEGAGNVSKEIEEKLDQLGFSIDIALVPFSRMYLWDKELKIEVEGTSIS